MCLTPTDMMSDDFFQYDPASNEWINLRDVIVGPRPLGRAAHGFTGGNGKIYLFGGLTDSGCFLNLTRALLLFLFLVCIMIPFYLFVVLSCTFSILHPISNA